MSVQVHAELVQALAGNAVVAKTPSQGGFHCLTLAHAFMARAGLPVTLLSGIGEQAGRRADQRRRHRGAGLRRRPVQRPRAAATTLADTGKRHFLEQEGLNAWGIWDFTQWDAARPAPAQGLRVRQAALHRLPALRRPAAAVARVPRARTCRWSQDMRFGHPLAVADDRRPVAGAGLRSGDPRPQGRAS